MATTPPGWYDDGHGAMRWWDGGQWTEHVHAPDAAPAPVAEAPVQTAQPVSPQPSYAAASPGYPGGPAPLGVAPWEQGGVFATPEKKTSKLWILWVVLGVVVLGLIVLSLVLIPLLFGLFAGAGADADEQAAVATVKQYDHAWGSANCDEYFGATSDSYRAFEQIEDCDTFVASSDSFTESTDDYALVVTSVETEGGKIVVETTETYTSPVDENGDPVDEPFPVETDYTYTLVRDGGSWVIDDKLY